MKIALASDHAGFSLKEETAHFLKGLGYQVLDFGTHNEESVDYPDFAHKVAVAVSLGQACLGILICGTGLGMAITANKVKGIRAVTCTDTFSARASRNHNNANVLCLGARVTGGGLALDIVKVWLESEFEAGRHERRLSKIMQIEAGK